MGDKLLLKWVFANAKWWYRLWFESTWKPHGINVQGKSGTNESSMMIVWCDKRETFKINQKITTLGQGQWILLCI